jgi:hypothetical protein
MDKGIKIFQYNNYPVTFNTGKSTMINATEMAKPFGKLAKDWLSNKSTKKFLSTLSAVRTIPLTGLVEIKQGGNGEQGTWMHEDVALEFARWLSPEFAIWCNDRIKELLLNGKVELNQSPSYTIEDPIARAEAWIQEQKKMQEEKKLLQLESDMWKKDSKEITEELVSHIPNLEFVERVATRQTKGMYKMKFIAGILNIRFRSNNSLLGRNRLYELLQDEEILDSDLIPYQEYINYGWFVLKMYPDNGSDEYEHYKDKPIVYVTDKGLYRILMRILRNHSERYVTDVNPDNFKTF